MTYTKISLESIKNWLKSNMNDERYEHSLGTADCAKSLANIYKLDEDKAYLTGLIHDAAKCFSTEKLMDIIDNHLDILPSERENHKTLHAPVSAYIAQTEFGITEEEILSAIRWHTIGKPNMTTFEKIIFLADKIELNTRNEDFSKNIRNTFEKTQNIDLALLTCYKETIKSLVDRNLKICPITIDIYNELQQQKKY